jgi:hypothetical protein
VSWVTAAAAAVPPCCECMICRRCHSSEVIPPLPRVVGALQAVDAFMPAHRSQTSPHLINTSTGRVLVLIPRVSFFCAAAPSYPCCRRWRAT